MNERRKISCSPPIFDPPNGIVGEWAMPARYPPRTAAEAITTPIIALNVAR
jgi:hypothetical protein